MNKQFKAIIEIHKFFTDENIPYVIIGGIALQHWGEPRFTRDVDVTIREGNWMWHTSGDGSVNSLKYWKWRR